MPEKGPEIKLEQDTIKGSPEGQKPSKEQMDATAQEALAEAQNQMIQQAADLFSRQLATGGDKAYREINAIRRDESQPDWKRAGAKRAISKHQQSQDS